MKHQTAFQTSTHSTLDPFNNQLTQQENDPIIFFNSLKDIYSTHIDALTNLKKQVFTSQYEGLLDQHQKSKIRITIESLLIDLNEEIFSISEELTKSITRNFSKVYLEEGKRIDFQQRCRQLEKKIQSSIDEDASVKIIRRNMRIQNHHTSTSLSPPQRDRNGIQNSNLQTVESDYQQNRNQRNQLFNHTQKSSPTQQQQQRTMTHNASHANMPHSTKNYQENSQYKQNTKKTFDSLSKKKSPTPLRRKDIAQGMSSNNVNRSFQIINSSSRNRKNSNTKQNNAAQTQRQQQSAAKRHLQFKTIDNTQSKPLNSFNGPRQMKETKLDEFEKFLEFKKQKNGNKSENQDPNSAVNNQTSQFSDQFMKIEGFQDFAKDFSLMKNKLLQLQQTVIMNEEKTQVLESNVDKLKTENLKLTTDIKIIRNEHSEILHKLISIDKRNKDLQRENEELKRLVVGSGLGIHRSMSNQDLQSNNENKNFDMPRQQAQTMDNRQSFDTNSLDQRKLSPFAKAMHSRDRSESKDDRNQIQGGVSRTIQLQKQNPLSAEFLSFQPSLNHTYKDSVQLDNQNDNQQFSYQQETMKNNNVQHLNQPSTFHNPLLSISNERINYNQSTLTQQATVSLVNQQPSSHSRLVSGSFNQRNLSNMHIQETPNTPDNIVMVLQQDETPQNIRRVGEGFISDQNSSYSYQNPSMQIQNPNNNLNLSYTQSNNGQNQKHQIISNYKRNMTPSMSQQNLNLSNATYQGINQTNNQGTEQEQLSDWVIERLRQQQK
eukprot:403377411